jgi:hypothetical protein
MDGVAQVATGTVFFALLESRCAGAYDAQPQSSARAVAKAVHRIKRAIDGAHDGLDRGLAALLD